MIEAIMPEDRMRGLRGAYLSTAQEIRDKQAKPLPNTDQAVLDADMELVVFASAHIDYDYIMQLIANFSQQAPGKQKMTREQLIALVESYSNFQDDRELLKEYILSLQEGEGLELKAILANYERFKNHQLEQEVSEIAERHGLQFEAVQDWVVAVLKRKSLDVEGLRALLDPLALGWRERNAKELALMDDLEPLLRRRAGHREIAGLKVYESKAEYDADGQ